MQYEIEFCVGCYLPTALDLTNALLEKHVHDEGFALKLVPGEAGQFDVRRDDQVVYSKADTKRLPTPGEIEPDLQGQTKIELEAASGKRCC
ncbi:MAG: Rdx family protein [Nitrososphaerota archaeon]|jgi:predicted Rdx family selenoprotein|nr:Rdx family protein [Nitrososphaerota archaeon]